jgi:hypothetical protein
LDNGAINYVNETVTQHQTAVDVTIDFDRELHTVPCTALENKIYIALEIGKK